MLGMRHVACDRHDGLLAVRGCVEEAVSSTFPHGIAFFVMRNMQPEETCNDNERGDSWNK